MDLAASFASRRGWQLLAALQAEGLKLAPYPAVELPIDSEVSMTSTKSTEAASPTEWSVKGTD